MTETIFTDTGVAIPPTQGELPCDDGVPMKTQRHKYQMDFLIEQLLLWLEQREDGYVSGNMFVYFSLAQVRNQDFKGLEMNSGDNISDLTLLIPMTGPVFILKVAFINR